MTIRVKACTTKQVSHKKRAGATTFIYMAFTTLIDVNIWRHYLSTLYLYMNICILEFIQCVFSLIYRVNLVYTIYLVCFKIHVRNDYLSIIIKPFSSSFW